MKTYFDHIEEITQDDLLKGLLGFGLFTEKLPPFLTSQGLYEFFLKPDNCIESTCDSKHKDYIRYENMRNINVPRQLSIPHPMAYARLCHELCKNWDHIKKYLKEKTENQPYKVSWVHIRKIKDQEHIFEMSYGNAYENEWSPTVDLIVKSKYVVRADISTFFPSIYSHAVTWALLGKDNIKKKDDVYRKNKWVDEIDLRLRNTNNNETNGILIGAHASNLISEIVLVSVDERLAKYKYLRHIDDYTCYVESHEEAESFLIDLSAELKKFNLVLNHKKTKITPLPKPILEHWKLKLSNFYFGEVKTKDDKLVLRLKGLKIYLDLSVELMKDESENAAILNYAIKVIAGKQLGTQEKFYYIKRLHHLVLIYPYLVHVLDEFVFFKFSIDKNNISHIANDVYELGIKKQYYEACSYALYFCIKYDLKIKGDENLCEKALGSEDCIFMLLAYLYDFKWGNSIEKYKISARELKDPDQYWLFIYEVLPASEFEDGFKCMKKQKVSFLNEEFKINLHRKRSSLPI